VRQVLLLPVQAQVVVVEILFLIPQLLMRLLDVSLLQAVAVAQGLKD
jgi:hypothetical protein